MQKSINEYVVRIYQDTDGEELIRLLYAHKSVKDCTLVGASNIPLAKIKYARQLQKEEELKRKFKEIQDA